VSQAAYRYVHNAFPADYKIIPNGIDVDHFARHSTPWPQYQDGKTNILFVGRLEKRKGLKYLLEAYGRLKWEQPNIRLLVVGPGTPDRDSFRILGARGLEDVVFAGKVSAEDLARYYASADIFCSPATGAESFGIVLVEAMAAGRPIVASDIEGYNGIVSHGQEGLLFPRKDPEALTKALSLLVENPQLARRLGANGRQTVEKYRWSVVASQVEDYYADCLRAANGFARKRAV
jgi:phosphatidylinositol alpha-mannosyltransferase